jgi:hypothetical protein
MLSRRLWAVRLVTAFAAVGLCCTSASAAPLLGTKTSADRAEWRSLLHWPTSCERSWRQSGAVGAGIDRWPAQGRTHLVAVECFEGAYQARSVIYLVGARRAVTGPMRFRIYVDLGNGPKPRTQTAILGVLSFRPMSGRLTVLDKGRGIADCGIYSVFRLHAKAFVPVEARAKTACDNKPPFDPTRWPKLPLP